MADFETFCNCDFEDADTFCLCMRRLPSLVVQRPCEQCVRGQHDLEPK